jgi:hypothetical protein
MHDNSPLKTTTIRAAVLAARISIRVKTGQELLDLLGLALVARGIAGFQYHGLVGARSHCDQPGSQTARGLILRRYAAYLQLDALHWLCRLVG